MATGITGKRIVFTETGSADVLKLVDFEVAMPSADEVLVELKAIGVNPLDWKLRNGYRPLENSEPQLAGFDGAGVVLAVAEGETDFEPGDRVAIVSSQGTYTTHQLVPKRKLCKIPEAVSFDEAASLGIPAGTAYQGLNSLGLQAGDTLLVHGASGSVGQAVVQLAINLGAKVIGTASVKNHAKLEALGAIPVAYGPGLAERLEEASGGKIDVVFSTVLTDEAIDTSLHFVKNPKKIGTIVSNERWAEAQVQAWSGGSKIPMTETENRQRYEAIPFTLDLIANKKFRVEIAAKFPLSQAGDAQEASQNGKLRGKILLVP